MRIIWLIHNKIIYIFIIHIIDIRKMLRPALMITTHTIKIIAFCFYFSLGAFIMIV